MADSLPISECHDTEHGGVGWHNPLQPVGSDLIRVGSRCWFV